MSDNSNASQEEQQAVNNAFHEDFLNMEMYSFDMVDGEKNVGEIHISIHRSKLSSRGDVYPDSFFVENSNKLKPILEIDGFGTIGNSGSGYGRAGLQRAYEVSLEKGCEGRLGVHATWGAGSFYEHCGFKGKEKGKPGIKYFEPTPENIEKLYKGGKRENLALQEAKPFGDFRFDELVEQETPQLKTESQTVKPTLSPLILRKVRDR